MQDTITIDSITPLARDWGRLDRYQVTHARRDGTRQTVHREVYDHGSAAAVLMYAALHSDRLPTISEISETYGVSRNHIMKVVYELGVAGYIASFPIPEVVMGINAFILGAQSVNPEYKLKVVWANTWFDPGKERDAAVALASQGRLLCSAASMLDARRPTLNDAMTEP